MNPPIRLASVTAVLLFCVLGFAILTIYADGPWSVALSEAVILTLAAVWCVWSIIRPFPVRLHPVLIPLAAICGLGAIQLAARISISPWDTAVELLRWVACFAAFALALQIGAIPAVRARFLTALLYFGFAFSAVAAVQYLNDPSKIFGFFDPAIPGQYMGPLSNKDHYASFLLLLVPLALYHAFSAKRRLLFGVVMAAILFSSVIEGASRAGSSLIVVETVLLLWIAYRRRLPAAQNGIRTFVIPLVAIAVLTVAIGWTRLWERAHEANPYLARQQILASSVNMIRERPIAGFGLGNFRNAYPRFAQFDSGELLEHAHNDWAEWTVEGGLPLLLLVLTAMLLSARALWRSFWAIGVLFVFTHGLVEFPMQRPAIAFWVWVVMGVACATPGIKKSPASRH